MRAAQRAAEAAAAAATRRQSDTQRKKQWRSSKANNLRIFELGNASLGRVGVVVNYHKNVRRFVYNQLKVVFYANAPEPAVVAKGKGHEDGTGEEPFAVSGRQQNRGGSWGLVVEEEGI